VTINGVSVNDIHNGTGAPPVPGNEAINTDAAPLGDSVDGAADGSWDTLRPGDTVEFSATYTVMQQDIDTLQ
jgi:large repetitive protein